MTIQEFEAAYAALGENPKTKSIDDFGKKLIREKTDVSFLRPLVAQGKYYRTYYQVSLAALPAIESKLAFIEDNASLMCDWWHTDCLPGFLGNSLGFDLALERAREYVHSPLPYLRRWGYVLFIPRLVRDPARIEPVFALFHDDQAYHVVMAQAWLLSYLAMCDPDRTFRFLRDCSLSYAIVGKAIQKICDSHQIPAQSKARFKTLRPLRRPVSGR